MNFSLLCTVATNLAAVKKVIEQKPHIIYANDAPHSIELAVKDIVSSERWEVTYEKAEKTVKVLKHREHTKKLYDYQKIDGIEKPKGEFLQNKNIPKLGGGVVKH